MDTLVLGLACGDNLDLNLGEAENGLGLLASPGATLFPHLDPQSLGDHGQPAWAVEEGYPERRGKGRVPIRKGVPASLFDFK